MPEIRPFRRSDRDALLSIVNRHIAAVLPGVAVPAAALLSHLERDANEVIIDPWVVERATLVAYERGRLVAAVHLKRYGTDERVSASYRGAGEIAWLVCWRDATDAGRDLLAAAMQVLEQWRVRVWYADGSLPVIGVYGPPEAWPHVIDMYLKAGFSNESGQVEVQFLVDPRDVPEPGEPPMNGLSLRRGVGDWGTLFEAILDGERVAECEIEDDYTKGGAVAGLAGWGDLQNVFVREDLRRQGIGSWLFRTAAAWMRVGGTHRFLAYAVESRSDQLPPLAPLEPYDVVAPFYQRQGLAVLNRIPRGWRRHPTPSG